MIRAILLRAMPWRMPILQGGKHRIAIVCDRGALLLGECRPDGQGYDQRRYDDSSIHRVANLSHLVSS